MTDKTVAVGMSGGVDSTMAALLLQRHGYKVLGVTMQIWDGPPSPEYKGGGGCYSADEVHEIAQARETTKKLGIEHFAIDLKAEYRDTVLKYFCFEYSCGNTPNPCVVCNRKIKFGKLIEKALASGIHFDYFATGHYARVEKANSGRFLLKKGADKNKDQSYFLWGLGQEQLAKLIFPLGELTKREIKKLAAEAGFTDVAEQEESQDFISETAYPTLFSPEQMKPGKIFDMEGREVGSHEGIVRYTIGQRKGLGISGTKEPLYVVKINAKNNSITVGPKETLLSKTLCANSLNWITCAPQPGDKVKVRIRQQHPEADATVIESANDSVKIDFAKPQLSVTPGQSAVFYDGDIVVGGGIISAI